MKYVKDIPKLKARYEKALKELEKCEGNCKECDFCHIYFADSKDGHTIYYAFGCDVLPQENFTVMSDTMRELKKEAVDQLNFELKYGITF